MRFYTSLLLTCSLQKRRSFNSFPTLVFLWLFVCAQRCVQQVIQKIAVAFGSLMVTNISSCQDNFNCNDVTLLHLIQVSASLEYVLISQTEYSHVCNCNYEELHFFLSRVIF